MLRYGILNTVQIYCCSVGWGLCGALFSDISFLSWLDFLGIEILSQAYTLRYILPAVLAVLLVMLLFVLVRFSGGRK